VTNAVLWLRRDLRLADHPALLAALDDASGADGAGGAEGEVLALFVLDDALLRPAGPPRRAFLAGCLRELDEATGGRLCVRAGDPAEVVPAVAREVEAPRVHHSADFGPYGAERDRRVARALADDGRELVATGSPYAVAPGRLATAAGTPFRVFTPYYRAWVEHGWRAPAAEPAKVPWATVRSDRRPGPGLGPDPDADLPPDLPPPGERAALARLDEFVERHLAGYADARDAPGRDATSRLSPYLRFGCVHPRTVLARLGRSGQGQPAALRDRGLRPFSRSLRAGGQPAALRDRGLRPFSRSLRAGGRSDLGAGAETFRKELAWREFYADVLFATPSSARHDLTPSARAMSYEEPGEEFEAWKAGRTGFPIVDAGMRQLRAEGWMHNRVRMIVASFLCKDLHVHWWHGARYFMARLVDGDLASNNHGWQWVAGTGADAAPYFRVFNPVAQGEKFDPDGTYIRRYVPELAELSGREIHEPWKRSGGPPGGYPLPIVDHAEQRREALARYQHARESP